MNIEELFIDGNKLPRPLTKKEVYELMDKINLGDNEAKEKLIHHNIRLVLYRVTKRFNNVKYDPKELVSIGNVGLIKAVATFELAKNVEFATYATRCIDNEILMFLRKIKKDENIDSLDKPIMYDKEGNELKFEDLISDDIDIAEEYTNNEAHRLIRKIVKDLPERDRKIIMLHFGFYNDETHTQKEIADILSISQSYVSRLITKTTKRLGKQLEQKGLIELRTEHIEKDKSKYKKEGGIKMARGLRTIYDYFKDYTKEQVDVMLSKLNEEEKILITRRYGEDLEIVAKTKLTKEETTRFYGTVIPKMKRLLANPDYDYNVSRKKTTIYEYFKDYTKEQVDIMLSKLNEDEKNLIKCRYGENLEVIADTKLTKEETNKFYCSLLPKMKKLIANPDKEYKPRKKEEKSIVKNLKENNLVETESEETIMNKQDCVKMLELLRTPNFEQMLNHLTVKEAVIVSLRLGYVNEKVFSSYDIANFLGIEEEEVRETTKKVLLVYKENINDFLDKVIDVTTDKPLTKIK